MLASLVHRVCSALGVGLLAASAAASTVSVETIAREGQIAPGGDGSVITSFNSPFTNSLGQTGFTGILESGERFVWFNDGVIWLNAYGLPDHVLTGTEHTMGISDDGGFIYSPSTDGTDSVYTHNGLLARGTDPAPGIPGQYLTFNSRPRMLPDGTAVWMAGFREDPKSATSQGRVWYVCTDTANPATIATLLKTGDVIDGFTIASPSGIGFSHDSSEDGKHHITIITVAGHPSATNQFIWLDGDLVLRKGDPVGDGTTWNTLRAMSVNNAGDWALTGNTSGGPSAEADFLALNGQILVRRSDTLDNITIGSNWTANWASVNNLGQIAHVWQGGSGDSTAGALFVTLDPDDVAGSTVALGAVGWLIDTTGDGQPDARLSRFRASAVIGPGLDFSDHPWVYAQVTVNDILNLRSGEFGPSYDAILRFAVPGAAPKCPADLNDDGAVDVLDLLILLDAWGPAPGPPPHPADLNGDGAVDVLDLLILLDAWGPC